MPFKVLAFAPFRPQEEIWDREPIQVNSANLDEAIETLGIELYLPLPQNLCPAGGLTIRWQKFKDFHPDQTIEAHPYTKNLLEARKFFEKAPSQGLSEEETYRRLQEWPDLPLEIKFERRKPKATSTSTIEDILKMVALPDGNSISAGVTTSFVAQIDSILQGILSHIFSAEKFKELESVWRGLRFLMKRGKANGNVLVGIVPVSSETLEETLNRSLSRLIQDPPSLMLFNLSFDNSPRSLSFLEKIALFAETLLVPALCSIVPNFFYLNTWQELNRLLFLPHYLEEPAFAKWRNFCRSSSAKWVAMVGNRFLDRYPYGPDNKPALVRFEEPGIPWINPVWAAASLICQSFHKTGWPTRFTEWQSIKVEDLALIPVEGNKTLPTEFLPPEERMDQFIRAGFIPLVSSYNRDSAFIPAEATISGGSLIYQLFISRITHFLLWCKDHFAGHLEPAEIEKNLRQAFSLWWERTGHYPPRTLEIRVSRPNLEKPAVVQLTLEPSRQILPSGEKVELEFNW